MNAAIYQHFHAWKGIADCINPLLGIWLLAAAFSLRSPNVGAGKIGAGKVIERNEFLWRSMAAITVVFLVGHLNRWLHLWHDHRMFPSGHMGFSVCAAIALGVWNRKTLAILIPLLMVQSWLMIALRFHDLLDIVGAVILASIVSWLFLRPKAENLAASSARL